MPLTRSRSSTIASSTSSGRGVEPVVGLRRVLGGDLGGGQAKLEQDAHEPLLRAVVQVATEPPALGVGGRHDARAGGAQLGVAGPLGRLAARRLLGLHA